MSVAEGARDHDGSSDPPPRGYARPKHVTPGGIEEFDDRVLGYARELAAEIDHRAVVGRGDTLSLNGTTVSRIADDVDRRRAGRGRALRVRLAALLLTVGTFAATVAGNYLNSIWQIAVFAAFACVAVVGLGLAWSVGTMSPDHRGGQ